ncbi:hypothetical protein NKH77_50770 [Streptomyces sp. M19]
MAILRERFADLDNYRLADLFAGGPDAYRPLLARWTPRTCGIRSRT